MIHCNLKSNFRFVSAIVLLSGVFLLNSASAQAGKSYAPGRLLLKLKEDVPFSLQKAGQNSYDLATADQALNALNKTYASSAMLAFPSLMRTDPATGAVTIFSSSARAEEVKRKFPQRTGRARSAKPIPELNRWLVLTLKEGVSVEEALSAYQASPNVKYAQPDYTVTHCLAPNDPYYVTSGSWGQSYQDLYGLHLIDAGQAWDITTGSQDITVAVIDSGIDYNHPDIQGNIWINPGEDLNGNGMVDQSDFDGIDNDGNGYTDDIRGWDFRGASGEDNDPMDTFGHGTHCAGTIAAVGNNGLGVVGVTWHSKVMAVKGFSDGSAPLTSISYLADCIHYAADNGADVLNNSWANLVPNPSNPIAEEAVLYACNLGCVAVFAAGNLSFNVMCYSPQNMKETITVAATDDDDERASFSNWGGAIDVAAPGVGILSLRAAGTDMYISQGQPDIHIVDDDYYWANGTSMACPHVAGLAALLLSHNPALSNEEVKEMIRAGADDVEEPGWDDKTGYGRINAYQTLSQALPPAQPYLYVPQQYATIQAAIDAAVSGQTVLVSSGTYLTETSITPKSGVDITGEDKETTFIIADNPFVPVPSPCIISFLNVNDCTLSGFTIMVPESGSNMTGLVWMHLSHDICLADNIFLNGFQGIRISSDTSVTIRDNIFHNINMQWEFGLPAITTYGAAPACNINLDIKNNIILSNSAGICICLADANSQASIVNNVIYNNSLQGIRIVALAGSSPSLIIKNNIITANGKGIDNGGGVSASLYEVSYNDVWGNGTNYFNCFPDIGNISENPLFTAPGDGDFQLAANSPCINAGAPGGLYLDPDGSRNDMGVYGGPTPEMTATWRIVPAQYAAIPAAVYNASPGDTVMVMDGVYNLCSGIGAYGTYDIVVNKDIRIQSANGAASTTIGVTGLGLGNAFYICTGLTGDTVIEGFTITGASGIDSWNGIEIAYNSSPIIRNNVLIGPGPLFFSGSSYGIYADNSLPLINKNIIKGFKYGICNSSPLLEINNATIVENDIGVNSFSAGAASFRMKNCIVYNNNSSFGGGGGSNSVSYSDVSGWTGGGEGNINANPLFAGAGNYHLQQGSPCINAGNPAAEYCDLDGTRNDMGAYGGPDVLAPIIITSPENGQTVSSFMPVITWNTSGIVPAENLRLVISHPENALPKYSGLKSHFQRCFVMILDCLATPACADENSPVKTAFTVVDLNVVVPNTGTYTIPAGALSSAVSYKLELSLEAAPAVKDIVYFQSPP